MHWTADDTQLISSRELAKRAGITYRQIDLWVHKGLITPVVEAKGSGTCRRWGEYQVGEALEIKVRYSTDSHNHKQKGMYDK